ncbi:MAG: transposase, partial [Thermoplasmatota archaeon]
NWIKVNALIDAATKTVLSWKFSGPHEHDTKFLPGLVKAVRAPIRELYADAGYLSNANCWAARAAGAKPYIRPKKNTRQAPPKPLGPDTRTAFHRMVGEEQTNPTQWYQHYGRRNGIEATFGAIKRRFGGRIRATNPLMRLTEAALKLLTWNLTRIRYGEF